MSRASRNLMRSRLDRFLSIADDERFLMLVWSVNALQSGRALNVAQTIRYPFEAVTDSMNSSYYIHPWRLETIVNELMCVNKARTAKGARSRQLDCSQFDAMLAVITALQNLENAEDALFISSSNILREIHRLAQRQFEWQRKALSIGRFYRSGYLYGGPLSRDAFAIKHKISLDDFVLTCFALISQCFRYPVFNRDIDLSLVGINAETRNRVIDIVSTTRIHARHLAQAMRPHIGHVSYKKSVLRSYPCIAFGSSRQRLCTPLPDLLIQRSTVGLFYDTLSNDGRVRNEISARFHSYCIEVVQAMRPELQVQTEISYNYAGQQIQSPDIIVSDPDIMLFCECKATKMSFEAKFSEDPLNEAKRGYKEIVKAVTQIWRFKAHHRLMPSKPIAVPQTTCGMVLTLETWLNMANDLQDEILQTARKTLTASGLSLIADDFIPICFCAVEDLENTLAVSSQTSFLPAVLAAGEARFRGWELSGVHSEITTQMNAPQPYPFRDRIPEVFSWWNVRPA